MTIYITTRGVSPLVSRLRDLAINHRGRANPLSTRLLRRKRGSMWPVRFGLPERRDVIQRLTLRIRMAP